ncbi:M1 family aminopeptidase [Flavobacterium capsici]|uniref:Aminopeptidase N n=1 Tax=Flavobacterium capsici TaxID=3075618 RepID=A0AA96EZQ8_9FLAO|nr:MULTISPECIES: M1 family aminopeptidase [unclassified Flavobacterium]WNM19827.1 M1 family aminopeptidase [Flavobacterium sp. PMR2A8]WNM21216.1 M1 family aminopeptidase [Flavobacterium sp. PMTSA4]
MKKIYFLLFCLSISYVYSQKSKLNVETIAEAEMKSASALMNLQVNPNTANYDVTYHRLEFTLNPSVYFITGKVTTTFKALSNMTTVTFDLTNQLTVSSVKIGTTNLSFVQNANNELVITLPTTLTTNNFATVEINYSGQPATGEQAFTQETHSGTPVIYTLSEPFGARDWWPCKQDLNDKVDSIDVFITAPSQYVSVANGIETTAPVINGANKTTHFHHGYPIPAYLIAIAVTNYQVFNQTAGTAPNTFPIINYIYPENYSSSVTALAQTLPIMNLYETLIEPYPFRNEKYGHAQFGWGGGMEHTTVSFMYNFSRGLIAHELGHQWFGDKVTCGSWKDIWLNEGFATYMAAMVIENFDGIPAFVSEKASMINNITSQPNGNVYLTDTQATNVNRIFSSRLSYNKGAMILEMLRFKMGDTAFFQALRNYLADVNLAYKYAVTTDLKGHLEAVYGQSLTEFFNDWVYNQGYPTYTITAQNWGTGQARFTVSQTQSDASVSFFEMPVPVRIFGSGGQQYDVVLQNTTNNQQFIVNVPFTITSVSFDPDKHLIAKNSTATLGNSVVEWNQAISVYPNPTNSYIYIQKPSDLEISAVTLFNSLGQIVLKSNSTEVSIEELSSGVYELQLTTNQGNFHKRIIKQ